jgi:hypothetical protein
VTFYIPASSVWTIYKTCTVNGEYEEEEETWRDVAVVMGFLLLGKTTRRRRRIPSLRNGRIEIFKSIRFISKRLACAQPDKFGSYLIITEPLARTL